MVAHYSVCVCSREQTSSLPQQADLSTYSDKVAILDAASPPFDWVKGLETIRVNKIPELRCMSDGEKLQVQNQRSPGFQV